jgi:hypothetical protein
LKKEVLNFVRYDCLNVKVTQNSRPNENSRLNDKNISTNSNLRDELD